MRTTKLIFLHWVIFCFLLATTVGHAESVSDQFTQISPGKSLGQGEYVHGQGYGKILMRILIFGSVPQQGIHYMPEGTDLLFAILYAGGYGDMSKLNGISIRRRNVPELIQVDLEDLIEDGEPIPKLVDGDVLNVPFNWKKSWKEMEFFSGMFMSLTTLVLSIIALTK